MKLRTYLLPALCLAALLPAAASAQTISTVAGNGSTTNTGDDGPATSAGIGYSVGVVAAPDGGFYIGGYNIVRRVGTDGVIRTVAGNGTAGSDGDGGQATAAHLSGNMSGLAIGPDGNLYIADSNNSRIRMIDGTGRITTIATVTFPQSLAFDPAGNLYIGASCEVHRRTPAGVLARFAGTGNCGTASGDGGQAIAATLSGFVYGIAVDAAGNVWVSHDGEALADRLLRKIGPDGVISTPAITGVTLAQSMGLAADTAGRVYAVQRAGYYVLQIEADGITGSVVAGRFAFPGFEGDGGPATDAKLDTPWGMGIAQGGLLIADSFNKRIRHVAGDYTPVPFTPKPSTTCASEGYTGTKLTWCRNICEMGYTGATLDMWIRRWTDRYRQLPYCAAN